MANILYISNINPVAFYKEVPDTDDQFRSRHMDDWYFSDTILPWQQATRFELPWQTSDLIQMQIQCNYGPINLQVFRDSDDIVIDTIPFQQIRANYNDPTLFIYEIDVDMSIYDEGCYYFKITFGSPVVLTLKSENIKLSENHENTLLLSYSNYRMYADMIFETGFASSLRIPATLKFKGPASNDTVYKDQVLNTQIVRSVPFRVWTLQIGGSEGIPDYLADKIFGIIGCSNFQVDGKYYVKNEGATMEPLEEENYPMRGWNIEVVPKIARTQKIYENELSQDAFLAVMINTDSKGFGADNGGNETIITDVV